MIKRIIKNGKLELVAQLVGGPQDGIFISINGPDRIRFFKPPSISFRVTTECPKQVVMLEEIIYERVSLEKYVLKD